MRNTPLVTVNAAARVSGRAACLAAFLIACPAATARAADPCERHALGFSDRNVDSTVPFDGILGGASTEGELAVSVDLGEIGAARVFPAIIQSLSAEEDPDFKVQGWSVSIAIDGDARCVSAQYEGTAAEGHHFGFHVADCIDPERNGGRHGVVGAVVGGDFFPDGVLPAQGSFAILDVAVGAAAPQDVAPLSARLSYVDGLAGSGFPVVNALGVQGSTTIPCNRDVAALDLRFIPDGVIPFRRGDANFDGALDVSDPVTILRQQFHGDARVECDDAADANDDGHLDIADAIAIFGYLFLGTAAPPPPFEAPGIDLTADALRCRPQGGVSSLP